MCRKPAFCCWQDSLLHLTFSVYVPISGAEKPPLLVTGWTGRALMLLSCIQVHVLQEQAKRPRLGNPAAALRPAGALVGRSLEDSAHRRPPFTETTNHNNRCCLPAAVRAVHHAALSAPLLMHLLLSLIPKALPLCRPTNFTDLEALIAGDRGMSSGKNVFARCAAWYAHSDVDISSDEGMPRLCKWCKLQTKAQYSNVAPHVQDLQHARAYHYIVHSWDAVQSWAGNVSMQRSA